MGQTVTTGGFKDSEIFGIWSVNYAINFYLHRAKSHAKAYQNAL